MNLIVVESPNKAKTIQSYIGNSSNWKTIATKGYIVDLPKNEMGVYQEGKKISGKWVYQTGKKQLIEEIKKYVKNGGTIFVATDDDREGEKIAFDIFEKLEVDKMQNVPSKELSLEKSQKIQLCSQLKMQERLISLQLMQQ